MMVLLCSYLILVSSAEVTSAEEIAGDTVAEEPSPHCFSSDKVKERKQDPKYRSIKKLFVDKNIPTSEVVARLIYAETKAAGEACQAHDKKIADYISQVIQNRYKKLLSKSKGDATEIVFQQFQFASSLHKYPESKISEFLCPKSSALWSEALTRGKNIAAGIWVTSSFDSDVYNYYLFKHSTRFTEPKWTKTLKEAPIKDTEIGACIRFYKNPSYKP